jgi:hypothetical protein
MTVTELGERIPVRLGSASKLRLAGEIIIGYGRVRWAIRRHPLPRAVELVRAAPRPPAVGSYDVRRLARAVRRTLEWLPVDSSCLLSSLVLLRMLATRGVRGSLVIAVRPGAELGLDAHAWVELDSRPLLAPAPTDYRRLLTL